MTKSFWNTCMSSVFSILMIPALTLGATAAQPAPAAPPPSEQADSLYAARLLNRMQADSYRVFNNANLLQSYYLSGLTWEMDAARINRIASRVKKMDNMIYNLRVIKPDVDPAQSRTIARLAPQVIVLTNEVNNSIRFLNNNHHDLWSPTWRAYTNDIFSTSSIVRHDLRGVKEELEASLHEPATGKMAG